MINIDQEKKLKAIDQKLPEPNSDQSSDAPTGEKKELQAKLQSTPRVHQESGLEKTAEKSSSEVQEGKASDPRSLEERAVDGVDKAISVLKKGLGLFDFLPRVLSKAFNRHLNSDFAEVFGILGSAVGIMGIVASIVACATTPMFFGMLGAGAASAMWTRFNYLLAQNARD